MTEKCREVQICRDPYHEQVTPENTPERIAETKRLMERGLLIVYGTDTRSYNRSPVQDSTTPSHSHDPHLYSVASSTIF